MLSSAENFDYPGLCKSPKQTGASTVEIIVLCKTLTSIYLDIWLLCPLVNRIMLRAERGNGIPIDEYLE